MRLSEGFWKHQSRTLFAGVFFMGVIGVLFGDALWGKSALWGWDWEVWFHPYIFSFEQRWQHHHLLLWNSHFGLGYPQFAEGQSLELYPPMLVLLKLLPFWWAVNLCMAGHYLLAALGTYAFCRRCGLPAGSALLASCTFAFSGFLTSRYIHPGVVIASCWMPVLLTQVEAGLQSKRIVPHFVWAGVIVVLQILGGHQQFTFYSLLLTFIYILYRVFAGSPEYYFSDSLPDSGNSDASRRQNIRPQLKIEHRRAARLALSGLGVIALIAVGLGSLQLIATYELVPHIFRRALPRDTFVTGYGLPPENLLTFLLPHLFGTAHNYAGGAFFWETCAYVTLLPWMAALAGLLLQPRNRNLWFWIGVIVGALLLAIVDSNPLYRALPSIPVFNWFRVPARHVMLCDFGLAMLMGYGHALLTRADAPGLRRAVAGLAACAILVVAVTAIANFVFCGGQHFLLAGLQGQSAQAFFHPVKTRADAIFNSLAGWDSLFLLLHAVAGTALLIVMAQRRLPYRIATAVLLALLVTDLSRVMLTMQKRVAPEYFQYEPPVVAFLKRQPGLFRVWTWQADVAAARQSPHLSGLPDDYIEKGFIQPNANLWSDISHLSSTAGLDLLRPFNLIKYVSLEPEEQFLSGIDASGTQPIVMSGMGWQARSGVLSLLNVRFLVTTQNLEQPGWKQIYNDGLRVYENSRVLPRAFLVGAARVASPAEALSTVISPDFDPRSVALLEEKPNLDLPSVSPRRFDGKAIIGNYTDTEISVQTSSNAPSILVLSDAFYPGWRAWVDGTEVPIVIADYAVRGIALPPGRHDVVCRYQPRWWLPALGAGIFTTVAIGLVLVIFGARRKAGTNCDHDVWGKPVRGMDNE